MRLPGYRIGDSLARSPRTAVNRAVREPGGEKVVLKYAARDYPLADEVLRLEFEHRILDKLRGPGVVELLGVERLGRSPVLVLEDFGATSLADVSLRGWSGPTTSSAGLWTSSSSKAALSTEKRVGATRAR